MLRRIGQFFRDLSETIKRERGKLQINSNPVGFKLKTGSLSSTEDDIIIQDSRTLQQMFFSLDIKDDIPEVMIKGESEHTHSPRVSTATISFKPEFKKMMDNNTYQPIRNARFEINQDISFKESEFNQFQNLNLVTDHFDNKEINEFQVKELSEINVFRFSVQTDVLGTHKTVVNNGNMKTETVIHDLETEYEQMQQASFHFENSTVFNALVEDYKMTPSVRCQHSLGCVMRYPIKRFRVSKSGYEREELKRALSFIVKRYESTGKLSIVGIYKNVPIDNAERLTFTKDNELYFYLKKGNVGRSILMDVLVVKTKEGRYHVGPIIRKT